MAFAATTEWDCRVSGSDSNGGGFNTAAAGTDRSQQDTAFITFTDLVIGGTNTTITSAANPFDATSPGNVINITGGTGFTVQRIQIVSVAGAVATCDKAVGTAGSTGGAAKLGGALATIGAVNALIVAGNTVHLKSGTYTQTTAIVVVPNTVTFRGFGTTHNDRGTRPLITTATNSVNLFTTSGNAGTQIWDNLSLSNTAATRGSGILQLITHGTTQWWIIRGCLLDGFSTGVNGDNAGSDFDLNNVLVENSEIKNCTGPGVNSFVGNLWIIGSWIHNNGGTGVTQGSTAAFVTVDRSIISGNGALAGLNMNGGVWITNSTVANNTGIGIFPSTGAPYVLLRNVVAYGNSTRDISLSSPMTNLARSLVMSQNNAYGTSNNWGPSQGDVTLTASPFTNSGAGNFSLNNTAGGGAACRGAGYPGVFPSALSTSLLDIGAVQVVGTARAQPQSFVVA